MPRQAGLQMPAPGCGREAGAGVKSFHPGFLGVRGQVREMAQGSPPLWALGLFLAV